MMLVRPPMTNFKMTLRADLLFRHVAPSLSLQKLLPPTVSAGWGGIGLWTGVHPPPWLLASKIVRVSLPSNLASLPALEQLDPTFDYTPAEHPVSERTQRSFLRSVSKPSLFLAFFS